MTGRAAIMLAGLCAAAPSLAMAREDKTRTPPAPLSPALVRSASLTLLPPERRSATPRIAVEQPNGGDLLPGDRKLPTDLRDPMRMVPREPGSTIDARMSMRLDEGRDTRAAFGLGGIGGAIMRIGEALID